MTIKDINILLLVAYSIVLGIRYGGEVHPDIPMLGIKGGKYDIQRFIYLNFLKCFWKDEWSFELNKSTNYDRYAPSNAKRFSMDEFLQLAKDNDMQTIFFHQEEACYSGRFKKV